MLRTGNDLPCAVSGIAVLAAVFLATLGSPHAAAEPELLVVPGDAAPGAHVTLFFRNFSPGGYPGLILFDGVAAERFLIPIGSEILSRPFAIPLDASPGSHVVTMCAATLGGSCTTLELEQRASAPMTVSGFAPPPASFDVLARAVEVTQGVRTSIPVRPSRGTDSYFVEDPFEHVPRRRTIVRVHPWMFVESDGAIPPITAEITLYSVGGVLLPTLPPPIRPVNSLIEIDPEETLEDTRVSAFRSWNFVLPHDWTTEEEIGLRVQVNPPGPSHQTECTGCGTNNLFFVTVSFRQVQTQDVRVKLYSTELFWRDAAGRAQSLAPLPIDIADSLNWWLKTSPIDPTFLRLESRLKRMSWDYVSNVAITPPIPGVPSALDVMREVDAENVGSQQFYTFLPILMNHRSHPNPPPGGSEPYGCRGFGHVGRIDDPPLNFLTGTCGRAFAHEATHGLGLKHSCNAPPCSHDEDTRGGLGSLNPAYPNPHGAVEKDAYGFDVWNLSVTGPGTPTSHTHDFMSYGFPEWVSMYNWQIIRGPFRSIPPPASAASSAIAGFTAAEGEMRFLQISGQILADDTVELDPAFLVTLPGDSPPPDDDPGGEYFLRLVGHGNQILFVRQFDAILRADHSFTEAVFSELIPVIAGVNRITLARGATELADVSVSASAPHVQLDEPAGGEHWPSTGTVRLSWEAVDPDGDGLHYRLEASRDGRRWEILGSARGGTGIELDLARIPLGASDWDLRIQASDGFHVAEDVVGPITVAPKPPRALILSPLHQRVLSATRDVTFYGLATDLQDSEIEDQSLVWFLDGKHLGFGRRVDVPEVAPGQHVASLSATNSYGLTDTMQVRFFVETASPHPDLDSDDDGLVDLVEWVVYRTHPLVADSDQDLLDDGFEVELGSDPRNPDTDQDGITDGEEVGFGSDPLVFDEDADGDRAADAVDNCPSVPNPEQADFDLDGIGDACDPDADQDDVPDAQDRCLLTPLSVIVDDQGCSIDQLCPCDAPWKNHGAYVSCVAHASKAFVAASLITPQERSAIVSAAGQSSCGAKK